MSRRSVLVGAAALALLGTATAACGSPAPPPELAEFVTQRDRAEADNRLAGDAATAARPTVAPALTVVASERAAHARALADEISRITGTPTSTATTSSTTPTTTTTSAAPPPPPTVGDVAAALRQSADSATQLAIQQSGYRAGLLGSIAAACATAYRVALAPADSAASSAPQSTAPPTPPTTSPTEKATTASRPSETAEPTRPANGADGALFDAIATEHGVIYGYGLVSAHSTTDVNDLVSAALAEHRARREAAIAMLGARSVAPPGPAVGYQLPTPVTTPTDAAALAVRMENDAAVAWRAVAEQATATENRAFAITALTECAIAAARWNQVLGVSPVTVAFPGGTE